MYKIDASVASDSNYKEQKIEQEYTITQAKNTWTIQPAINGWTYGQPASAVIGKAGGCCIYIYRSK